MKKKTCKNKMKKNQAYSLLSGEPIDISNCIQVGEDVKFPEYEINKKIHLSILIIKNPFFYQQIMMKIKNNLNKKC